MPLTTVRNALRHPVDLANGPALGPLETADADLSIEHNQQLVDDGLLEVVPRPEPKRRAKSKPTPQTSPSGEKTPKEAESA